MTKAQLLKYWKCISKLVCKQAEDCPMGTGKAVECLEAIAQITALIEGQPDEPEVGRGGPEEEK